MRGNQAKGVWKRERRREFLAQIVFKGQDNKKNSYKFTSFIFFWDVDNKQPAKHKAVEQNSIIFQNDVNVCSCVLNKFKPISKPFRLLAVSHTNNIELFVYFLSFGIYGLKGMLVSKPRYSYKKRLWNSEFWPDFLQVNFVFQVKKKISSMTFS